MKVSKKEFIEVFSLWHKSNLERPEDHFDAEEFEEKDYAEATYNTFMEYLKEVRDESK